LIGLFGQKVLDFADELPYSRRLFQKPMTKGVPETFYRYFPVAKRDRDWGLYVTTVGEARLGPGTVVYPPAGHPKGYDFPPPVGRLLREYQIVYVTAGQGWFKSAATGRVRIHAGMVMLLFPGVWHSYAPSLKTGWTEHWIGFNGDLARRLASHGFFTVDRPILRARQEDKLLALYNDLMEAARTNHPALQQIMAGTAFRLLGLLYSVEQARLTGEDPSLEIIHRAVTRLREAVEAPIGITDLAAELKVGYRWFRRAFAHHTGLSPHQYFLDIRLARARDLLTQTTLSVKEIGARIGLEDAQYFCRLFHKKVGMTPGAWRERGRRVQR
jgi:AraC-like DNA-binding protein